MTASGLCEVCKKVTGYYTYEKPEGWYCEHHMNDVEKIRKQPVEIKLNRHERRKAGK